MPRAEPDALTPAEIATLRSRLVAERSRLRSDDGFLSSVREPPERSADMMDEADASLEQHEALGRSRHDRSHLAEVERALQRMEAGTYGFSDVSGEPIGYARLDAVPWARLTAAEQEDLEAEARRR